MKLVRLMLIALLSLSLPSLGLASVVTATPCCAMQSGQQHMAAVDGQSQCAEMSSGHASGGCDNPSEHACKADGKCGGCGHIPSATSQASLSFPAATTVATVAFQDTVFSSRSPDGLWHPPRNI